MLLSTPGGPDIHALNGSGRRLPASRASLTGHSVVTRSEPIGGAQAIWVNDTGVLDSGSHPRKDGCAPGY